MTTIPTFNPRQATLVAAIGYPLIFVATPAAFSKARLMLGLFTRSTRARQPTAELRPRKQP